MSKGNQQLQHDDDDIIILSSGSDSDNDEEAPSNSGKIHTGKTKPSHSSKVTEPDQDIKVEKETEQAAEPPDVSNQFNNNSANTTVPRRENMPTTMTNTVNEQSLASTFNFSAFSLFGPENASMPIEDRLASFISNVQSLTEDKVKLENEQRAGRRLYEEANSQLNTAKHEISKLKDNLAASHIKLTHRDNSISTLKNEVEKLQREGNGSKSKIRSITSTLENLQKKMEEILDDAEVDSSFLVSGAIRPNTRERAAVIAMSPGSTASGSSTLTEVILRENIDNFERDFEAKFSEIEEQDKEIKTELLKTNGMLQRIQASLMEQFQAGPSASSSPLLTYESMEDQDIDDEQSEPVPCSSRSTSSSTASSGNYTIMGKKVSHAEDSKTNTLLHARDTTKKNGCICGVRYKTKFSLNRHLRMESGQNHFTCNICAATFFELCSLRKHYESAHELHYPSNVSGCTACGKVFDSFDVLQKHRKRCNGETELPASNNA